MLQKLHKLDQWLGAYLPLEKLYYTLLVVYLSIATNDIQLPRGSFLRQNYLFHLIIIFVLSYFSLTMGGKHVFGSRVLAALIVTFVFYIITKPKQYDIFSKDFYKKFGIYPAT